MPISIKGSGGGGVTLDAGAAASATTLTLPNVSGTVLQSGTAVTVAQGGTGLTTLTVNNVLLGNGTSAVQAVAPGTSGNVLVSNGTTWASAPPSGGGQIQYALFTAGETWTAPTGVTKALVTVIGAGGGGVSNAYTGAGGPFAWYGGSGGFAIAFVTVSPGTGYTITIGAGGAGVAGNSSGVITGTSGGTSSFGSLITCTGGGATSVSGSGVITYPSNGSGSTTGTMLRNGAQGTPGNNSIGQYALGIFSGRDTVGPTTSSSATAWTVGALYGPGVPGNSSSLSSSPNAWGGVNGAIFIQYVG